MTYVSLRKLCGETESSRDGARDSLHEKFIQQLPERNRQLELTHVNAEMLLFILDYIVSRLNVICWYLVRFVFK